jgi:hypothetical protein
MLTVKGEDLDLDLSRVLASDNLFLRLADRQKNYT